MSNPAESKPVQAPGERTLAQLKTAILGRNWRVASVCVDRLRLGFGWKYSRFVAEFGDEWESHAQEMDALDGEDSE